MAHVSADSPPFLIYQGTEDTAVNPFQAVELDQAQRPAREGVPQQTLFIQGIGLRIPALRPTRLPRTCCPRFSPSWNTSLNGSGAIQK